MKLSVFADKYYLHDGLITCINYDKETREVYIDIDFCFWVQDNYHEGDPETLNAQLRFTGVHSFDNGGLNGEIDYYSILDSIWENGRLTFNVLDDFNDEYYSLNIEADDAEFIVPDGQG